LVGQKKGCNDCSVAFSRREEKKKRIKARVKKERGRRERAEFLHRERETGDPLKNAEKGGRVVGPSFRGDEKGRGSLETRFGEPEYFSSKEKKNFPKQRQKGKKVCDVRHLQRGKGEKKNRSGSGKGATRVVNGEGGVLRIGPISSMRGKREEEKGASDSCWQEKKGSPPSFILYRRNRGGKGRPFPPIKGKGRLTSPSLIF